jgi:hypothetical protein
MGGLLALLILTAVVLAGASALSTPEPQRTGPFHWHVTFANKRKYYFEPIGTSNDGYPKLQCPFYETEYVNRG